MKPHRKSLKGRQKAYALFLVMIFMAISFIILTGTVRWTSSSTLQTARNNQYNTTVFAAEAATESVISQMMRDFQYQGVNSNTAAYGTLVPSAVSSNSWADGYEFTDGLGSQSRALVTNTYPPVVTNLNSEFTGLYGLVDSYRVIANAKEKNALFAVTTAVKQDFQLALIPIFQFAIFYNMELEINPGPVMTVTGKVHGNSDLYLAPVSGLTFQDSVTAVGNFYYNRHPNDPQGAYASKVMPVFKAQRKEHVSSLTLPIGTNNSPTEVRRILDVPPAGENPKSPIGKQRYYNKCDLLVDVTAAGVSVKTGQWDNFAAVPPNTTNGYSFIKTTASFYDEREGRWTVTTDVDVLALKNWMASAAGGPVNTRAISKMAHQINSIYVDDRRLISGKLTVARVINGQFLPPSGLTVASRLPLYVKGHFNAPTPGSANTSATLPASLVGDAITVLSGAWSDANSSRPYSQKIAADTTVNAAFLAGIVKTTLSSGQKKYSGGVENFPRFLEDWSSRTFTYNGSMVVMFESQFAKSFWQTPGNYYDPPVRKWAFDINFLDYRKLPPGTPQVQKLVRAQWDVVAANSLQ